MKLPPLKSLFLSLTFALTLLTHTGLNAQDKIEVILQSGHYDDIQALAFSPDGKHLASAGADSKVTVWDLTTGKIFRELKGHKKGITSLAFSRDGKVLLSGGDRQDMDLVWWDWKSGRELRRVEDANSNSIEAIAISPDGQLVATGTYRELKVWKMATADPVYEIIGKGPYQDMRIKHTVHSIAFSDDGRWLGFGYVGGAAQICDALTGVEVHNLNVKEAGGQSTAVAFSADGKSFFTGGSMRDVIEWSTKDGSVLGKMPSPGSGSPCPCDFHLPTMAYYVLCSKEVDRLNLETGTPDYHLRDVLSWRSGALAVSADGKLLAVAGDGHDDNTSIVIMNARTGARLRNLKGYPGTIVSLDFGGKGEMLAVGSRQRHARLWDLSTSRGFVNYTAGNGGGGDAYANVRISKDRKRIFKAEQNGTYCWDLRSGEEAGYLRSGGRSFSSIAMSPDGRYVVTAPGKINVHDMGSLEEAHKLPAPRLQNRGIAYNADGSILYGCGFKEIKRFDGKTFEELPHLETKHYCWGLAASRDGKQLATKEYSQVYIRDAASGELLQMLGEKDEKNDVPVYSPDGKWLATASGYEVRVWNTADYSRKYTLTGHIDVVNALAFTPDGRFLASGADDTCIILWDLRTGKQAACMLALDKEDYIIITPDNYYMTSKNGVHGVAFRKGDKVYPFEQFDLLFNRPDIVLERLGYASQELIDAYRRSYEKRLKKTGFNEQDLKFDLDLPELQLLNREALGLESKDGKLLLKVKATGKSAALDRIHVWLNDVPVYGAMGLTAGGTKSVTRDLEIELLPGNNKIQVATMNKHGVESLKETVHIRNTGSSGKPDLYVVGIGASEFQAKEYNLNFAAKDAQDLAATLSQSGAFAAVKSKLLLNTDVTRSNIQGLKGFLANAQTQDVVLLFVAGHGVLDAKFDYYFATHDMDFANPSRNGVEYTELEKLLDGIKAIRKLLIMDTCHSGELDKDEVEEDNSMKVEQGAVTFRNVGVGVRKKSGMGSVNASELMKELFTDLRRGTGATVISSAGGAEFAMESAEWNNGLFTFCLLESLKAGRSDLNRDGRVHMSELQEYVTNKVRELSMGRQVPTSRMENHSLDYHIW